MNIYFCRNSSMHVVDVETSKVEYVPDTSFYISIVKKDGFINNYEGDRVEVKEGDVLVFRDGRVSTIDTLDTFIKLYVDNRGTKPADDCCVNCESEIK